MGEKVNFDGKIKRWLEIILGAILGDSGYFWVLMKKVPKWVVVQKSKYFPEKVNYEDWKHVMLVAIFGAIFRISTDFSFLQKSIFYNEIYFSSKL